MPSCLFQPGLPPLLALLSLSMEYFLASAPCHIHSMVVLGHTCGTVPALQDLELVKRLSEQMMSSVAESTCGAQGVCRRELLPEVPHVWSALNHQRFRLNRPQPLVFTPAHPVIYSKSPTYKLLSGFKDVNVFTCPIMLV